VEKERRQDGINECDEDDPRLLAALDERLRKPMQLHGRGIQRTTFDPFG